MRDSGYFEIMLILLIKLAEILFGANCWKDNRICLLQMSRGFFHHEVEADL